MQAVTKRYTEAPLTPPRIDLGRIPKGYPGTRITARHIWRLIRSGAKDFYVRQKAIDILLARGIEPKDYLGEIQAIFEWVQRNIRYTKDPFRIEALHSARRMLELRAGDCDDMSILLGGMLEAIGHPVRLVLTGPDPLRPRIFTHVYVEVHHGGRWIPLDPTMPYPMGWAPRAWTKEVAPFMGERRSDVVVQGDSLQGVAASRAVPDWLIGLIRAVRREGLGPRDPRVRQLWELLRSRQLLARSPWMRRVLRHVWRQGLPAGRQRPRMTGQLVALLRAWGILPRPLRPRQRLRVRGFPPFRQIRVVRRPRYPRPRPVRLQPVRPVTVRPISAVRVRDFRRRVGQR